MYGLKAWKLLVYSHASVTKYSDEPTRMFPPIASIIPPTDIVGSVSPSIIMRESIEVVVVLPWVPLTATEYL